MHLGINSFFKSFFLSFNKFYSSIKYIVGFRPSNLKLYRIALIHKSASIISEDGSLINNERLEFLGDAIFDAIIAEYLYNQFSDKNEGFLTKLRSNIVNGEHESYLSEKIGLNKLIISNISNSKYSKHLYEDVFEAFIGAVFLDKGYETTKNFILNKIIKQHIDIKKLASTDTNYKSKLVEWSQKDKKPIFFDTALDKSRINSDEALFVSHIKIEDKIFGEGFGSSKKEAEQNAAKKTLQNIGV
ncbi:MAG: ribonuclease III [Bacteroidales bacterium]|nr:ribonuclease III [Bacteroidales bacterium]